MQLREWSSDLSSYRKTWSNRLQGSIKFHDKTVEGNAIIFKPYLYMKFYSFSYQTFIPKGNVLHKLITELSEQMCTLSCCFHQQEVWRHFKRQTNERSWLFSSPEVHTYIWTPFCCNGLIECCCGNTGTKVYLIGSYVEKSAHISNSLGFWTEKYFGALFLGIIFIPCLDIILVKIHVFPVLLLSLC